MRNDGWIGAVLLKVPSLPHGEGVDLRQEKPRRQEEFWIAQRTRHGSWVSTLSPVMMEGLPPTPNLRLGVFHVV